MKRLFNHLLTLLALAAFFLAMTSCNGDQDSNVKPTNTVANTVTKQQPSSLNYPPLPSSLANAEFEMLDGAKFKLSDKKGKVLLINLWATWCGPCIGEMPHLRAMQDKYGSKGFEVIGLNIGEYEGPPEPPAKIRAFVAKQQLNYTIAISPQNLTNQFQAIAQKPYIPQSFLIDREGRLRGVFAGGGESIIRSMKENVAEVMAES